MTMTSKTPFDYIKDINSGNAQDVGEGYNIFLTNRAYSYHIDTVSLANEMNRFADIDPQQQYDFYLATVPKGGRWSKWYKPKPHPDATAIAHYFGISLRNAYEYLELLDQEQLHTIKNELKIKEESEK